MIPYEMRKSSIILEKVTEYLLKFTTIHFRLNEYILVTKLLTVGVTRMSEIVQCLTVRRDRSLFLIHIKSKTGFLTNYWFSDSDSRIQANQRPRLMTSHV